MKNIILILALLLCSLAATAQKTIELDPTKQICYNTGRITVNPTGKTDDSTFQIYYAIYDTNGHKFEDGNKEIPHQYYMLFTPSGNPQALAQLLLSFGLYMKMPEE